MHPSLRLTLLAVLLVFAATALAAQNRLSGRVVGISDGDTLVLLTPEKRQVKVRLGEIDTPEKRQPYGNKARQALADKVFQREVTVAVQDTDRYGRKVGRVLLEERDINAEMVAEGHAWVYRQYLRDRSLLDLEAEARERRRGLWALSEFERVPPWEWRRTQRALSDTRKATSYACGEKRYCKQMSSCAEASFHLLQCGRASLDPDRDGRPCEALCR